jgi:hypothetical protein
LLELMRLQRVQLLLVVLLRALLLLGMLLELELLQLMRSEQRLHGLVVVEHLLVASKLVCRL